MVKQYVAGIKVPEVANDAKLCKFVKNVYEAVGKNCSVAADEIGVSPATVWKIVENKQKGSQVIRDTLNIRKCRLRHRVWMPTNNLERAIEVITAHYPDIIIIDGNGFQYRRRKDRKNNIAR